VLVLTLVVRVRVVARMPGADGPRKILFIELSEMGSTIIASAMIRRVQERYRDAEHCFCIFRKNAASLRLLGLFREECIFRIRDDSLAHMATDVWRFITFCRRERIDTVIDLELFSRISSLISMVSGVRTASVFQPSRRGPLPRRTSDAPVHYNPYHHVAEFLAGRGARSLDEIPTPKRFIPAQSPRCGRPDAEAFEYVRRAAPLLPADRPAQHRGRQPRRRQHAADPVGRASVSSR
jgi:ADP-heptose:LPS heptosyltransferase